MDEPCSLIGKACLGFSRRPGAQDIKCFGDEVVPPRSIRAPERNKLANRCNVDGP